MQSRDHRLQLSRILSIRFLLLKNSSNSTKLQKLLFRSDKTESPQKCNHDQGTHLTIIIMNIHWKTVRHFVFIQKHFDIVRWLCFKGIRFTRHSYDFSFINLINTKPREKDRGKSDCPIWTFVTSNELSSVAVRLVDYETAKVLVKSFYESSFPENHWKNVECQINEI